MESEQVTAQITLHGAADWSPEGRRAVAEWITRQALDLMENGGLYSKHFTARYLTEPKDATPRHINEAGLKMIKDSEGLRNTAYRCPGGVWTIGYGHTAGVKAGKSCTNRQAEEWLREDCAVAERAVTDLVRVPLTDNQFAALVSWTFNLGRQNLADSTLLKKLNAGDYDAVPSELLRWTKSNGRTLPGLVSRRAKEAELWERE